MAPNHAKEGKLVQSFSDGDRGHYNMCENGKGVTGQQVNGCSVFDGSNDTMGLQKMDMCSIPLDSQLGRENRAYFKPNTKSDSKPT